MKRKIVLTKDGSTSIYLPELDEHYHSSHGALQEALHVFIEAGLHSCRKESLRVFELGFGTGLNALLTLVHRGGVQVDYTGLEAYPVESEEAFQLNYCEQIGGFQKEFELMHTVEWDKFSEILPGFNLKKVCQKIEDYTVDPGSFDLIYFDAFGHRAQEEMWDFAVLEKIADLLCSGGTFVTYAARGQLKRDLITLGFDVEKLPGPPGKREMTRAIKK